MTEASHRQFSSVGFVAFAYGHSIAWEETGFSEEHPLARRKEPSKVLTTNSGFARMCVCDHAGFPCSTHASEGLRDGLLESRAAHETGEPWIKAASYSSAIFFANTDVTAQHGEKSTEMLRSYSDGIDEMRERTSGGGADTSMTSKCFSTSFSPACINHTLPVRSTPVT